MTGAWTPIEFELCNGLHRSRHMYVSPREHRKSSCSTVVSKDDPNGHGQGPSRPHQILVTSNFKCCLTRMLQRDRSHSALGPPSKNHDLLIGMMVPDIYFPSHCLKDIRQYYSASLFYEKGFKFDLFVCAQPHSTGQDAYQSALIVQQ